MSDHGCERPDECPICTYGRGVLIIGGKDVTHFRDVPDGDRGGYGLMTGRDK